MWRYAGATMCGRYVINDDAGALADYFGVDRVVTDPLDRSYNVAPTEEVYGVAEHGGARLLGVFRWGLIPHWARDRKGPLNINARAETVATRPAFRDSLRRKRCIIPASGFFEWGPKATGRRPYYVTMADRRPMGFAGIWASWRDPDSGDGCGADHNHPRQRGPLLDPYEDAGDPRAARLGSVAGPRHQITGSWWSPLNINARAETVATRPAFRDSLRRKRCIIPASGFFEWGPKATGRRPYYVTMADRRPMGFAGIWASWRDPDSGEWMRSCAIITTRANEALSSIHTRMPVILEPHGGICGWTATSDHPSWWSPYWRRSPPIG